MIHRRVRVLVAACLTTSVAVSAPTISGQTPSREMLSLHQGGVRVPVPRVRSQTLPAYPEEARAAGVRGVIDVETAIGSNGRVMNAHVAAGVGNRNLDLAAATAVMAWTFEPALVEGRPAPVLIIVRFTISPLTPEVQAAALSIRPDTPKSIPPTPNDAIDLTSKGKPPEGLREPSLLRSVEPTYTADAMRAKVQGAVELQVVVLPDGGVGWVRVAKSLDNQLDREAIEAVRLWRFKPATFNGQPVAAIVRGILEFRLH